MEIKLVGEVYGWVTGQARPRSQYSGRGESRVVTGRECDASGAPVSGVESVIVLRRRKNDLLRRARLVIEFGWEQFRYQWSNGEVLGTALVLHDRDEMLHWAETVDSVQCRWAFALRGIDGGHTDVNAGCAATLAWFDSIRAELAGNRPKPATT